MVKKTLRLLNLVMAAALLVACLWPLNPFPHNDITWLPGGGLWFGKHGLIVSSGLFKFPLDEHSSDCTLEISLQPAVGYVHNSATLLVVYTPDNPLQFRLMQYGDELLIRRNYRDKNNHLKNVEIELEHVFNTEAPVTFVITSGPGSAVAYRDGLPAGASKKMHLSCQDFSGQLLLGDSPISDNAWQGKLFSLSIYNRELTAAEVSRDFAARNSNPKAANVQNTEGLAAHYTFAEGTGKIIHNSAGSAPGLYIPDSFRILHKKILTPPWKEFTADNLYVFDVTKNVVGFIPFGFLLCFYLGWDRPRKRAMLLTILAGATMSTTIEVLQIFIPSRTSGMTDIITNTIGSALGALLWYSAPVQGLVNKLRHVDNSDSGHGEKSTGV